MTRGAIVAVSAILAANLTLAQDVQTPPVLDPSVILSRALEKLAETTADLGKYTCLETIHRAYYFQPLRKLGRKVRTEAPKESCDGIGFDRDGHLLLDSEDRLRLQVAVSNGEEIDSWANASRFDSRSILELIPVGPASTGAFGTSLHDIFENPGVLYTFIGKKTDGSREVFEYAFAVSLPVSHYFVSTGNGWRKIAYQGSFEIDAATADLTRVTSETAELTLDTQMCRGRTTTDYHHVPLEGGQFLIPSTSEYDTVSPNAIETHSIATFSACHEYAARSSLAFDYEPSAASPEAGVKVVLAAAAPLPAGLSLTLSLLTPIDASSAAAGDAVSAMVTRPVRAAGSKEILVSAGSIVHGRLLEMRHQYGTSHFLYSILYDTLEQAGAVSPLAIRLDRELRDERLAQDGFSIPPSEFSLAPPAEAGSRFVVPARSGGYVVPAGSLSKWVTVAKEPSP
jgi:hypothetical protein